MADSIPILLTTVACFVEQKLELVLARSRDAPITLSKSSHYPPGRSLPRISRPRFSFPRRKGHPTIVISAARNHFLPFTWPIRREKSTCLTVSLLGTFYASSFPTERINVALPTPAVERELMISSLKYIKPRLPTEL